jgi:hypothetical protein
MKLRFQNKREKDLFDQFQTAEEKIKEKTKILLPDIKRSLNLSSENIIFIIIGFVMSCVIFFTLGVEKGRREVIQGLYKQGSLRQNLPPVSNVKKIDEAKKVAQVATQEASIKKNQDTQNKYYSVQLSCFKGKDAADREKAALKKIGYNADIRQSGNYYQLYIGGFKTKKDAQNMAERLKDRYNDCYVK